MAFWRVCLSLTLSGLILLMAPAAAAAQQPAVSISNAPSFADRHSSYTVTVTSTASPFTTATFSLAASFSDVTLSEANWSVACAGSSSCTSVRTITIFTSSTGGRNVTITATGRNGALTATAAANTWVRGAANFLPASLSMPTLQTQTVNVALQTSAPLGVTLQLSLNGPAASGSSVPSTVTIGAGSASAAFQITTGLNPGNLTISATTGSPYYTAPSPVTLTVVSPNEAPTPVGTNVTVTPPVPAGGSVPVQVTFSAVTAAGQTTLTNIAAPAAPPSGYENPGAPLYFGLSTTATTSGIVTVCASYPNGAAADETGLRLFTLTSGGWLDTTMSVDTGANRICGQTGGAGGWIFAIFRLNSAPAVGAISGPASIVAAGDAQAFTATFTDADPADTHTGVWIWGDGMTSPATIATVGGVKTATGEHAFAAGTHQARLVISDGGQGAASPDFQVIADGSAPVIESISASPARLWPPDGTMKDVTVAVSATDDTGMPVCRISGVTVDGRNVSQAAYAITGLLSVQLNASPRATYIVTVTCTDAVDRTAQATVTVRVEKVK